MAAASSSSSFSLSALRPSSHQQQLAASVSFSHGKMYCIGNLYLSNKKSWRSLGIVCHGMFAPRKFMQRKKAEVCEDGNLGKLIREIENSGTAISTLRNHKESIGKDTIIAIILRFKQMKKWNIIGEILEWLRTQDWWRFSERDYSMLVTAYGKQGDFVKAGRVLTYMRKKGFPPTVVTQTALMEAYSRSGQYSKAEAVFRKMQLSGPDPSPVTYQIILKAFVEANKYREAEEVFQTLLNDERSQFKPDQRMFHMMIYMYKKAGNSHEARRIFAVMAERGIPRTTDTFNSLMSFETCYKEVSKIYDQMQRSGLRPDVISYMALMRAYGKARREEQALAVFEEMLDADVRPTTEAYNTLLDAYAISGLVEEARNVFKSMRKNNCYPDCISYSTMLSAYVNASNMRGAETYFRSIRQNGFEPDVVMYGTLLKGYAKTNSIERMMKIYEEMRVQGIKPTMKILTTMMDVHGRFYSFGRAVEWYNQMEANGCPPDQKAKNILLSLAKTPEEKAEACELTGVEEWKKSEEDRSKDKEEEENEKVDAAYQDGDKRESDEDDDDDEADDEDEDDDDDDEDEDDDGDDNLNFHFESLEETEKKLALAATKQA